MKPEIVAILCCPECRGKLDLTVTAEEAGKVREGSLGCRACSGSYPIRNFVPRFVPDDGYVSSFSLEWNRFRRVQIDSVSGSDESARTLVEKTGFTPAVLKGKRVLDVGCGAGRFLDVAARDVEHVVGIDLSFAVDAARENLAARNNVTILQADLFKLPLREASFDLVYSIGVLHHTPDPERAFLSVVPALKPGGRIAIWLYSKRIEKFGMLLRPLALRLPLKWLYWICWLAVPLYPLYRLRFVEYVMRPIFFIVSHPNPRWRWLDTFDWYSPRYRFCYDYPEVWRWFVKAGLGDIELRDYPVALIGTRPR